MIVVNLKKNLITIEGHASDNNYGNDIVCASVSSIVYTTINAVLNFDKDSIKVVDNKNLSIKVIKNNKETEILLRNMVTLLEELKKQYSKKIKIIKGE